MADYAFVFYDAFNDTIIAAKDMFGKRSLLMGFKENGFVLSSCALKAKP